MKRFFIMLAILGCVIASGQAQDKLKIGEVKSGKLLLTNQDALKAYFMNSLEKSGTLGKDFQVSASPEGDRFFVYYPVSGNKDKVTNIGVMLVKLNNDVFIIENPSQTEEGPGGGGSLEVKCEGEDCNSCLPNIKWVVKNWLPIIFCDCKQPGGSGCNMTSTIVIHVDI